MEAGVTHKVYLYRHVFPNFPESQKALHSRKHSRAILRAGLGRSYTARCTTIAKVGGDAMALTKCGECGREVSTEAAACPGCGAPIKPPQPQTNKPGCLGQLLRGTLFALLLIIGVVWWIASTIDTPPARTTASTPRVSTPTAPAQPVGPAPWARYSRKDEMSGKNFTVAAVESQNTVRFGFPYEGEQRATLTIREKHPRYGTNVMLSIEAGQFLCHTDDCDVLVKFDDRAPKKYEASEPTDNSSTMLFLDAESTFISQLRQAKTVTIEATFYQEGIREFKFDAAGFAKLK